MDRTALLRRCLFAREHSRSSRPFCYGALMPRRPLCSLNSSSKGLASSCSNTWPWRDAEKLAARDRCAAHLRVLCFSPWVFVCVVRQLVSLPKAVEDQQCCTHGDGAVSNVERRVIPAVPVEEQKVDHFAERESVT